MESMRKIIVIGCPGAGKSTFARALHDLTGLPLHYLDTIWHRPDKTNVTRAQFDQALRDILDGERWIIDGNYGRTMELRMAACDTVFLLDYPTELCLAGAAARVGTVREDLPWVEETLDPEFRQWIVSFAQEQLPKIYQRLEAYWADRQVFIFKSREQAQDYLQTLKDEIEAVSDSGK